MDFTETDEQRMLREAVDGIASKYGHSYFAERARSGGNTDELWNELAEARVPRGQRPRRVRRRRDGHRRARHRPRRARHQRLSSSSAGRLPRHLRHDHRPLRLPGAEGVVAAALRVGPVEDGLRHHRARRRVQQPQDRHHRCPRRRHVAAQRDEVLHLGRGRVRRRPGGDAHRRRRGNGPGTPVAVHRRPRQRRVSTRRSSPSRSWPRRSSSRCSSTTWRFPPTDCSAPRATDCARSSWGSIPSAS